MIDVIDHRFDVHVCVDTSSEIYTPKPFQKLSSDSPTEA